MKKQKNGRIKKVLRSFMSSIFILTTIIIFISAFLFDGGPFSIHNNSPFLMLILGIIIVGIYSLIIKASQFLARRMSERQKKITILIFFFLLFATILYSAHTLSLTFSWDPNEIYWGMDELLKNGTLGNQLYFSHYPFNLLITIIGTCAAKVLWHFGINLGLHTILVALNCFFIFLTFLLSYFTIKNFVGRRRAFLTVIFLCVFTPFILYSPIYYSDTISAFFMILGLFFLSLIKTRKNPKCQIISSILLGLSISIAFIVKASTLIIFIAIAIYKIISKIKLTKSNLFKIGACLAAFLLCFAGNKILQHHYINDMTKQVPYIHWVEMGLHDYGGFSGEKQSETFRLLKNNQNITEQKLSSIHETLVGYGPGGFIEFLLKKISYTWSDGTYDVSEQVNKLPNRPDNWLSEIVRFDGNKFEYYLFYCNAIQAAFLLILLIGGVLTFKDKSSLLALKITLIGIFLFFLIWETTSRYLVNYLPVFTTLEIMLLEKIESHVIIIFNKRKMKCQTLRSQSSSQSTTSKNISANASIAFSPKP